MGVADVLVDVLTDVPPVRAAKKEVGAVHRRWKRRVVAKKADADGEEGTWTCRRWKRRVVAKKADADAVEVY